MKVFDWEVMAREWRSIIEKRDGGGKGRNIHRLTLSSS